MKNLMDYLINSKGITLNEIANEIGMNSSNLQRIYNLDRNLESDKMNKLLSIYGKDRKFCELAKLKIKITKCDCEDTWYRNSIGEEFEVLEIYNNFARIKKGNGERNYSVATKEVEFIMN